MAEHDSIGYKVQYKTACLAIHWYKILRIFLPPLLADSLKWSELHELKNYNWVLFLAIIEDISFIGS